MEVRAKISLIVVFFLLFRFFYYDSIIYTYFIHIAPSGTAIDDVISYRSRIDNLTRTCNILAFILEAYTGNCVYFGGLYWKLLKKFYASLTALVRLMMVRVGIRAYFFDGPPCISLCIILIQRFAQL